MAGRCVTRGTDAGLVHYSTMSTRETSREVGDKGLDAEGGKKGTLPDQATRCDERCEIGYFKGEE